MKNNRIVRLLLGFLLVTGGALGVLAAGGPATREAATAPGTRAAAATPASASASAPASAPATRVAATTQLTRAATGPTSREIERRQRLIALMRQSYALFEQKKYDQLEEVLDEALEIEPKQPTNLYNMACLQALTHRPEHALGYLERAASAGYTDFQHMERDSDLDGVRALPGYKALLARKDEFQLKAAEAVLASLRQRFGEGYLYEIDHEDKLVFATNTDQTTLDALKAMLLRQARSQWAQLFEHKPDQFITVVVPSRADFRKIVPMRGVDGFYNHEARILIASGLGFVTTHEFTHALHAADIDPLGQDHPSWLTEGLAVMFERAEYEGEVLTPRDNYRIVRLQAVARAKGLIPLSRLLVMPQRQFVSGDPMLCYAEAGSIVHYLYDQQLLRKFYDAYKADYDKDKSGKLALEAATGQKLEDFERDWRQWLLKRTPPAMNTGPNGPFLGLQFEQANDGIRVQAVVPGAAGERAGVRVGDVIIGLGETDVRDMVSFVPLLSEHKVGETLSLKLRRDHDYLDLPVTLGKRTDPPRPPATHPAATRPSATRPATTAAAAA